MLVGVSQSGFVNGLCFSEDGRRLVAAVGREHRRGRWWVLGGVRDGVVVVDLPEEVRRKATA